MKTSCAILRRASPALRGSLISGRGAPEDLVQLLVRPVGADLVRVVPADQLHLSTHRVLVVLEAVGAAGGLAVAGLPGFAVAPQQGCFRARSHRPERGLLG